MCVMSNLLWHLSFYVAVISCFIKIEFSWFRSLIWYFCRHTCLWKACWILPWRSTLSSVASHFIACVCMMDWLWRSRSYPCEARYMAWVPTTSLCHFMTLAEFTQKPTNFCRFIAISNRYKPRILVLPTRVVSFPMFWLSNNSIAGAVTAATRFAPLSLHDFHEAKKEKGHYRSCIAHAQKALKWVGQPSMELKRGAPPLYRTLVTSLNQITPCGLHVIIIWYRMLAIY